MFRYWFLGSFLLGKTASGKNGEKFPSCPKTHTFLTDHASVEETGTQVTWQKENGFV